MMTDEQIKTNWPSIKEKVLKQWDKLNSNDIEKSKGSPRVLSEIVARKYGKVKDFDKLYEKICNSSASSSSRKFHGTIDDFYDSPERRMKANLAKIDNLPNSNINRETEDELSAFTTHSRASIDDSEIDDFYQDSDNDQLYTQNTSPDELYLFQYPRKKNEDIPLGGHMPSATKFSSAQAASKSSEVTSTDGKKKM